MSWGRSRRQRSSSTGASHSSTAINPLQGEIWRDRDIIQVSVKLVLKRAFPYYSTSSIQGCYNKRRSGWKIPRVLQFSKVHIFSLFFHNISTQGPHNLPVWDFRLEEARNHWISGDGDLVEYLAYPAFILHRHVFSFNGETTTFLSGALSPVRASNGGAGGVFLDGTGADNDCWLLAARCKMTLCRCRSFPACSPLLCV